MTHKSNKKSGLFYLVLFALFFSGMAQQTNNRWHTNEQGGITWNIGDHIPHKDHIEMSGKRISAVVSYGVNDDGSFYIKRDLVWPMLRTIPNNTHASLMQDFHQNISEKMMINGKNVDEKVMQISLNGTIEVKSILNDGIELSRVLFPSTELPIYCEIYQIKNSSSEPIKISIPEVNDIVHTAKNKGVDGVYTLTTKVSVNGDYKLMPGEIIDFNMIIKGENFDEKYKEIDVDKELTKRKGLIYGFWNNLVLETPDEVLNKSFAFAKIRASESIYQTKGGPMHGPGGLSYYAAIWANDQAEYVNPFFPYLGYDYANESAINSYKHFARFMNDDYIRIPSSVIAEGIDIWQGAGDRGDAAMIAYGASRFVMSLGDKKVAEEFWPLIEWCLEYNHRKLNKEGVVASKTDELEGRFPTGKANLSTSSLYYDALISSEYLAKSLGKGQKLQDTYLSRATTLKNNIEKYFGADLKGFHTYKYYKGNKTLRAWICIPLTMDIFDRKEGTIDALFSPELWTDDGLATEAGDKTFWDRATLYGLRGVLAAGDTKRGIKFLKYYANRRLLGEHVPYPVEAYPEGGQKHLSAESGLYCRIFTEGLFGIRPTGLDSFNLRPQLPEGWNEMKLKKIHSFGEVFDIEVYKHNNGIKVLIVKNDQTVKEFIVASGKTVLVSFGN